MLDCNTFVQLESLPTWIRAYSILQVADPDDVVIMLHLMLSRFLCHVFCCPT